MLGKWLFQIAKSPLTGTLVGMGFEYCSRLLPVRKLFCSKEVLAFWHPQPSYQNHLIITPRKAIRNLQQMADARFSGYFVNIWEAVQSIQATQPAFQDSFVLIANGGKRQEVQQVHFHLFTHCRLIRESAANLSHGTLICRDDALDVMDPPTRNGNCISSAYPRNAKPIRPSISKRFCIPFSIWTTNSGSLKKAIR